MQAIDPALLRSMIEEELSAVSDQRVVEQVRSLLVEPSPTMRLWDYGELDGSHAEQYPCWTVLEHPTSETCIVYSGFGFGPSSPWGLLMSDPTASMGMDAQWYTRFLNVFFESPAAANLPIWQVFEQDPSDESLRPLTEELPEAEARMKAERLRTRHPTRRGRIVHGQSVYQSSE